MSLVPFSEVDNVILSLIAYVDLDDIIPPGEKLTLGEATAKYFQMHQRDKILARTDFVRMTPMLMEKAGVTRRFSDIVLHDYVNIIDTDAEEQFAAIAFDLADGTSYIGYRGTDDTIVGWKEDFNLAYVPQTPGQRHAADYLSEVGGRTDRALRAGGHSKGGNLAMYASAFCEKSVQSRILEVYNNDGPGFLKEVADAEEMKSIKSRIRCLVPEESLFGLLMYGDYHREVIKSSNYGVMQHDAMSWQVLGSRFIRAEVLTDASRMLDQTLRTWIDSIEPEERKKFIDLLFDAFTKAGASTLGELQDSKKYSAVMQALFSMDKDKRESFQKVIKSLFKSGTDTMAESFRKSLEDYGKQWER